MGYALIVVDTYVVKSLTHIFGNEYKRSQPHMDYVAVDNNDIVGLGKKNTVVCATNVGLFGRLDDSIGHPIPEKDKNDGNEVFERHVLLKKRV